MSKDDVRGWIDEATNRWRGDALRVGERARLDAQGALRGLGLVTREDWESWSCGSRSSSTG